MLKKCSGYKKYSNFFTNVFEVSNSVSKFLGQSSVTKILQVLKLSILPEQYCLHC